MKMDSLRFSILILSISLVSCGGSSGGGEPVDDDGASGTNIETRIQEDPSSLTVSELQTNYLEYVWHLYEGSKDLATITPGSAQVFASIVVIPEAYVIPNPPIDISDTSAKSNFKPGNSGTQAAKPELPTIGTQLYNKISNNITNIVAANPGLNKTSAKTATGAINAVDTTLDCAYGGTVTVEGEADDSGLGNFSIEYDNCNEYDVTVNGTGALSFVSLDLGQPASGAVYFNQVRIAYYETTFTVTGYTTFDLDYDAGAYDYSTNLLYENSAGHQQVQISTTELRTPVEGYTYEVNGNLYDSELGYVNWTRTYDYDQDTTIFSGASQKQVFLKYEYANVKLLVDQNGDEEAETGYSFSSWESFFAADFSTIELDDANNLSIAPYVSRPELLTASPDTTTEIRIQAGYFSDPDTPAEELHVSYTWSINGVEITPTTETTLAPGIAVKDDLLEIVMVVSDGKRTSESDPLTFTIADAPAAVMITGLPETVESGDSVAFSAVVSDPDTDGGASTAAKLAFGPSGMTVDTEGNVQWTVEDLIFDASEVKFAFKSATEDGSSVQEFSVLVETSEVTSPIARSGIDVPRVNHSMTIGDFIGDTNLEVLSADGSDRVFILRHIDGEYIQVWMYPYKLPSGGAVKQVLAHNLDDDEKEEIIVATDGGVSVIYNEGERAKTLLETDRFVYAIAVSESAEGDVNLAMLSNTYRYSTGGSTLDVLQIGATNEIVFSTTIVEDGQEILFGNVDGDPQSELVLNTGLVYDTLTWNNQWFNGSGFGDALLTLGDLDGDGIDEIIGGDNWDEIHLFSAVDKNTLYTLNNASTCSLTMSAPDASSKQQLLVGNCHWGYITGYSWDGVMLQESWALETQDSGSTSIAVGDSDNDGAVEVHWGSDGLFVVADLDPLPAIKWTGGSPQMSQFNASGWGEVSPGDERAVFMASGNEHLLYMKPSGRYTASEGTDPIWSAFAYGEVTDFNSDGYMDIFLTSPSTFLAAQMNDATVHWSYPGDYNNDIHIVVPFDIDEDSIIDATYADGSTVRIVNIQDSELIGSFSTDNRVRDIAVVKPSVSSPPTIAVASDGQLQLWQNSDSSTFELISSVDVSCGRINFGNVDDDAEYELVCAGGEYYYSLDTMFTLFDLTNDELEQTIQFSTKGEIKDFIFNTSRDNNQLILAAVTRDDYEGSVSVIEAYSPRFGHVVWTGPGLVGHIGHRSMHFRDLPSDSDKQRLMFATDKAMYLIK